MKSFCSALTPLAGYCRLFAAFLQVCFPVRGTSPHRPAFPRTSYNPQAPTGYLPIAALLQRLHINIIDGKVEVTGPGQSPLHSPLPLLLGGVRQDETLVLAVLNMLTCL